ncbi:MAG: Na+/H+ antiporter subunit G [Acidimicrobiaceae bacterium]|nr:Na+/H+ antiporter subunit G [Acidimicrobiaceae bacterium]
MDTVRDVITVILLGSGLSFMLIGAWGVVRLPDAYHRLHASSKCSTLGLFGMLAGAVVYIGTVDALIKAALTLLFTVVATPVGSHILAKAAHSRGLRQWDHTLSDELADDQRDGPPQV